MVHCCVLGCGNRSERKSENVTFHTFPKNDETRNRWIAFTGRKNWKPSKYDRMCSNHFESFCFYKTKFKVYLRNLALPTLCKFRTADTVLKSRTPVSRQGLQSTLRVPSYQTTPYNVKKLNKKMAKSSQVLANTGVVETDLCMNESQENGKNHEDEETDDAVNEDSDKEDNVEMVFDPTCMPVHTTLTVKDEVFDPEENFPHSIEVTVECDVEDITRDLTRNASNALTASGEPKAPSRGWGHRGRPAVVQLVKPVRPLVEKYTTDEDMPELPHDKQDRNAKVPEIEKNGIDNKEDNDEMLNEEVDLEDFQWKPVKGWQSLKRPFLQKYAGPTSVFTSPYATFRAFWDNSILSYIATETNRYVYTQSLTDETNDWVETNVDEILILFAFWIMLGIIKMPTIKACYAHNVPILRTDVFRRLLTESRYTNLIKSFYVVDDSRDPNDPDDILFHLRTLIDHLNVTFKDHCNVEQDICIDETSNLWKTPNCPVGIKIHHLCESKTGYIWSFLVDTNHKTNTSSLPDVVYVMKLMQPLLHLGHTLYTDSWFSTPLLARYLKHKHTNFVGTLRCFKDIPPLIKNAALNEGEFVARHCGDLLAVSCNGGKRQFFLSTCHGVNQICDPDVEPSGQYKLTVADDYERGMRKIDRMDYCVEPYLEQQIKWPLKLFKILLNMTINNAHVLLEKSTNVKIDSLGFRLSLVQAIIERHHNNIPRIEPTANLPAERLTGRHFIRRISLPDEEFGAKVNNICMIRKTCVWCTHNGRDSKTAFECSDCNVALCLDVCFEEFHTISG